MYMKLEKDLCEYGNRKEFETDAQPRDSVSVLSGVRGEVTNEQKWTGITRTLHAELRLIGNFCFRYEKVAENR